MDSVIELHEHRSQSFLCRLHVTQEEGKTLQEERDCFCDQNVSLFMEMCHLRHGLSDLLQL